MNQSNRIARQDFSKPRHEDLMSEMNDFIISVKLHYTIEAKTEDELQKIDKAKASRILPTWKDVEELLTKAVQELKSDRIDPIKRKY